MAGIRALIASFGVATSATAAVTVGGRAVSETTDEAASTVAMGTGVTVITVSRGVAARESPPKPSSEFSHAIAVINNMTAVTLNNVAGFDAK